MPELPEWQPLNGVAPPIAAVGDAGRIVALVASERAVADGWAAMAALELARGWTRDGHRVILIDGALQEPTLHTAAGVPNREGLSDATLHGASVARVSQPVDQGGFFLIPAGTPVADTNSVVRSGRWHRLSAGMTEAGVMIALYVRDGDSGTAAFMGSASDIVVLADRGEPTPSVVQDLEPLVRAVTGLSSGETAEGFRPSTDVQESSAEAGVAEESGAAVGAAGGPASVVDTGGGGGLMTMLLFVILAIVVASALGYVFWSGMG